MAASTVLHMEIYSGGAQHWGTEADASRAKELAPPFPHGGVL